MIFPVQQENIGAVRQDIHNTSSGRVCISGHARLTPALTEWQVGSMTRNVVTATIMKYCQVMCILGRTA